MTARPTRVFPSSRRLQDSSQLLAWTKAAYLQRYLTGQRRLQRALTGQISAGPTLEDPPPRTPPGHGGGEAKIGPPKISRYILLFPIYHTESDSKHTNPANNTRVMP